MKSTLTEPKHLILSILVASFVAAIGAIALLIPGIALGAFLWPVFWVEGKNRVAINRRCLELFLMDGRRFILCALCIYGGLGFASSLVGWIFSVIPVVGPYLGVLFNVAWSAAVGTFQLAFLVWFYFDLRAKYDSGDAVSEARARLS